MPSYIGYIIGGPEEWNPGYCKEDPVEVLKRVYSVFPIRRYKDAEFFDWREDVFGFDILDSERSSLKICFPRGVTITSTIDDLIPMMLDIFEKEKQRKYPHIIPLKNKMQWWAEIKRLIDYDEGKEIEKCAYYDIALDLVMATQKIEKPNVEDLKKILGK